MKSWKLNYILKNPMFELILHKRELLCSLQNLDPSRRSQQIRHPFYPLTFFSSNLKFCLYSPYFSSLYVRMLHHHLLLRLLHASTTRWRKYYIWDNHALWLLPFRVSKSLKYVKIYKQFCLSKVGGLPFLVVFSIFALFLERSWQTLKPTW